MADEKIILLRAKQVAEKMGISVATVYRRMSDDPLFPKPLRFNPRWTAWIENEINDYIRQKIDIARQQDNSQKTA